MRNYRRKRESSISILACLCLFSVVSSQSNDESMVVRGPCSLANIDGDCGKRDKRYGNVIIGGLFPVHKAERDDEGLVTCENTVTSLNEFGFERLEAMRYAVLKANREKVLGNISIGYEIRDTCQDSSYALRQSLSFLNIGSLNDGDYSFTVGVAGAARSGISIAVTDLLNLFGVPLVSYASTSAALSDTKRFPSFFRTLPPDKFQTRAMVDILLKLGWRYVHTASSTDVYGKDGIESFIEAARAAEIDIGVQLRLPRKTEDVQRARESIQMAVRGNLSNLSSANPLSRGNLMVIFAQLDVAKNVMAAIANTTELRNRKFTFIVSDDPGDKRESVYDPHENINSLAVARGMLSVIPESVKVKGLEDHMKSLNPNNYTFAENPWFAQYWEKRFGCNPLEGTNSSVYKCRNNNTLATATQPLDSKVAYVIDAVNVLVYALRDLLKDKCRGKVEMCSNASSCFEGLKFCSAEFKRYITNVRFEAQSGVEFKFDKAGDFVQAKYDIKNLHVDEQKTGNNDKFDFVSVGTWQLTSNRNDSLYLNDEKLLWLTGKRGVLNAPVTNCSEDCDPGQYRARISVGDSRVTFTCWNCTNCSRLHHYVSYETDWYGECKECPENATNSSHHTGCITLEVQYLKYGNGLAVFFVIFAVFGITLVAATFVTYFVRWGTPLIMASGRELSIVLLSGLLLCFLLTFVFIGEPTNLTCGIIRFCPAVFLSMVFGSLLIKTNRISRLFNRGPKVQRPPFISPLSQLALTAIIVAISCCIAAAWLMISPPDAETQVAIDHVKLVRICKNLVDPGLFVTWLWIFALIVVCTYYGLRTRKIPENFRETLFISFAAYSECVIWLALIPFGFIGLDDQYVTAIASLAIVLSALAAWGCLFVPKLYIVLLRPERNKRQTTHQPSSQPSMNSVGSHTQRWHVKDHKEKGSVE